jgi:Icc-related predicted phosphoesterase
MVEQRVTRVLCAADPGGAIDALLEVAAGADVQALALVGELGGGATLKALARSGLSAFWVPGPGDAPIASYLRESANLEVVAPALHGVHGTAAFADSHTVFAGFGGEVSDDPGAERDEIDSLRYPRWEPEYRLKILRELDEHELVLLFSTPPAHHSLGDGTGSDVLAELVGTYRPRLVVCGGPRGSEMIGRSPVVAPGRAGDGHYAIADIHSREVTLEEMPAGSRAS